MKIVIYFSSFSSNTVLIKNPIIKRIIPINNSLIVKVDINVFFMSNKKEEKENIRIRK